ncbi:hypothetical protein CLPU_5c00150 [Gottschalkia purinilytica]|uniref:Threonine/Serine exporter ThrE domain-containing protein n=1 Tax=Gottschalkia purinilytica TaxID=1503 RepID=A0A0L0WB33_GOTPU|nr:threonine/serine exporter family protein [Gottschalkia purinilytica]KNF08708.1 hypothetical protein CLPU_5c00150 [Gottschalkia purinilytica]
MIFYIKQALYAFLSTVGFAVLFNGPKDTLVNAGTCGAIGWLVNIIAKYLSNSSIVGTFLGATTAGLLGEAYAKIFKKPATVFIVPGIIPLVPGAGMYYTMLALIKKNFITAADIGSQTIFTAFSIAIAVIVSSSINRAIMKYREYIKQKKQLPDGSN